MFSNKGVLLIVACLGTAQPALADEIGKVALANGAVTGLPPGGSLRPLAVGTGVLLDERVSTGDSAKTELLFLDQTSLAVGPRTEITLDRFVYDPASGSGEMALSLTKGALRFIGGAASSGSPALVTTPTATIGIRGSSALISTDGRGTRAIFVAGDQMCIEARGRSTCTSEFGGILTEQGYQGQADPSELAELAEAVEGDPAVPEAGTRQGETDLTTLDLAEDVTPTTPPVSTRGTPIPPSESLAQAPDGEAAAPPAPDLPLPDPGAPCPVPTRGGVCP